MRDRFVRFGIAPARITVADNGTDPAPFASVTRTRSQRLRIGFIGSLMVSKAPHVLLEAVSRLPRGTASLDMVGGYSAYHGDDSYKSRLEPLLKHDAVRVHGAVPHDRIPSLLASLDVVVVPSVWAENSPVVIHEAFLAGVPVVASRLGGIPELVDDGKNGLLFRAGDIADLTRALERLVDEPALLDTLRAGIPRVRTIEEDARATRALYRHALTAERPPVSLNAGGVYGIVLNYRTPDQTLLAVRSLLASRRPLDAIIVVNNDAADDLRDALHQVMPKIVYVHTGRNLGFSGGMNVGIRQARALGAAAILLVNSDAIVPPDCVDQLERCLHATRGGGIAVPVLMSRSTPDQVLSSGITYDAATGRMRQHGSMMRREPRDTLPNAVVDAASGCVMLVKTAVFDAVGLLDEQYFFSFEDLEFCLRARRAGWSTVVAGDAVAYHDGGRSIGSHSPKRLYFAARNHLLLSRHAAPGSGRVASAGRGCAILAFNIAHAAIAPGGTLPARLAAVARGTRDYLRGSFGP
jgi:GT2 family glycosyltransferase